ncbi:MAG: PQQ-dependent sugar dehydrogenase [Gaiellaceae bacterium]
MRVTLLLLLSVLALVPACAGGGDTEREGATEPEAPGETEPEAPGETEPPSEGIRLVAVARGLDNPVHVAAAPGEPDRLYVVEQVGRIRIVADGRVEAEPFLDVASEVVSGGEQGLLSVAFHPDYAENGLLYVNYTNLSGDTRVVEYRALDDRTAVDPGTGRVLLAVDQPYPNHNGGQLAFGPDGRLWGGMGDGGAAGDPENRAQDLSSPLGKLLTLDVSETQPKREIAAYGLRNPWRFSFDPESEDLWIGDVGQGEFEEINRLPRDELSNLTNFGWDVFEGDAPYEDKEPNPEGSLMGPVAVYDHGEGCSVTGGFVYRGDDVPALDGRYVYGDYCSGTVWSIAGDGTRESVREEPIEVDRLTSFGEDGRGELYAASASGTVFRIAAS